MIVPSIQPLVAKWAPTGERSSISTFIFSGAQIGTVLGITFSGLIADFLGWEAVFYIQGSLAAVVVGMWLYVVYDSPELHPRISAKEKDYIRSSTFTSSSKVWPNKTCTFHVQMNMQAKGFLSSDIGSAMDVHCNFDSLLGSAGGHSWK